VIARLGLVRAWRRLLRAWCFVRSFFRRTWTLDDYPVVVRRLPRPAPDEQLPRPMRGLAPVPYLAFIDGLYVLGFGNTAEQARAGLAENFRAYCANRSSLPRPGTKRPRGSMLVNHDRIRAHGSLRDDFIARVLRLDPRQTFISDLSTLGDFLEERAEYNRRTTLLYGIDLDALPDDKIITILDAIAAR
jgi:hypothetical protein